MATVTLAEDTLLGRYVALKRVNTAGDDRAGSRLRREALVGASISHPNVVAIYDVLTPAEDGDVVIVMEYVRGETLRDALGREGRLPPPEALRVLRGAAAGLDAIHERGIVHRDVKPANILLGRDGSVKVADLGIASVPDRTRITTAGTVLGSFAYMAPEQLEDAPATTAIDIYALAAVAFEALSGRKAHQETHPVATAHAIATQPPPDLREAWPEAPERSAQTLARAMSRTPGERPATAGAFVEQLAEALAPAGPRTARPVASRAAAAGAAAAPPRPRPGPATRTDSSRKWVIAGLPLLLIAVAAALAVALSGPGGAARHSASNAAGKTAGARPRAGTHAVAAHSHPATPTTSSGAGTPSTAASSSTTASAPATSAGPSTAAVSPAPASGGAVGAVETFYTLAAAHHYAQAWALADPAFRAQLGGYQSFVAGQSGDRSITFDSARVLGQAGSTATVAVRTTSVRDNGTQHCGGTVQLARSGSGWLLHQISINCT